MEKSLIKYVPNCLKTKRILNTLINYLLILMISFKKNVFIIDPLLFISMVMASV
jgi:hypothetical protein